MRGTLGNLKEPKLLAGEQLAVLMWKKRDLSRCVHMATCASFDFANFGLVHQHMLL